ncbi:hypothetical protein R1sor_009356 [Riccia sorocarpa]|uniref:Uncharacterized protein n=1 Tax=Riccia sorocarpa TaxID=122646 RepID=A0ABD3HUU8_9MARC
MSCIEDSRLYYNMVEDYTAVEAEPQVFGISAMITKKEEFKMQLEDHQSVNMMSQHPEAYTQGVPMVEEIIRFWELSGMWTCSHAMHSQTRDLSMKGKKKLEEGQSEEDVRHRCVEFAPLPEEVASWFIET